MQATAAAPTIDLVHQRVRSNGYFSYKTSTVASVIIVTEFCERLAYYGLGGSLVLFFQTRMNMSNASADVNYSAWSGMCYVTPLLGGYIADSYLGRYNTILIFASIYLAGLAMMTIAASPSHEFHGLVMLALYIIALGTGGIKPNVCTLGADQFDDRVEEEKDAKASFFSWFYFSINCGAAVAYTFVSYICQYGAGAASGGVEWGFYYGFLIPTISMAVGVVTFVAGKRVFGYAGSGRVGSGNDEMVDDSSVSSSDSSHALNPDQGKRGSMNPMFNPAAALQFQPDEIRREINRMRFFKRQAELDEAEMRRQEMVDGDVSPTNLRVARTIGSDAEELGRLDRAPVAGAKAAAGGGTEKDSAWDPMWDRHPSAPASASKYPEYDDATIQKWHHEIVYSEPDPYAQDDALEAYRLPIVAKRVVTRSEVSVLFGVLFEGITLYMKEKLGFGKGKFIPPVAGREVGGGDASSADGFDDAEGGIVMVDFGSGRRGSDRAAPSSRTPRQQRHARAHVLDYACQDNYPKQDPLSIEHLTIKQLRRGENGVAPGVGQYTLKDVKSAKLVTRLLPFLFVFVMFWTIYSQMSVGFQNQGCQMDLRLGDSAGAFKIPISALNLFDTLAILAIVPILDKFVYPWLKRRNGTAPPLLQRIMVGFFFAAAAMCVAGIVEQVRRGLLPTYDYAAGKGYYNDPAAIANASPCANLDEYNPAAYEAWWQYQNAKDIYDRRMEAGDDFIFINGFKVYSDAAAPAYCRQTCSSTWFQTGNIESSNPYDTLHLNSTCIACNPIPQVSRMSVMWQIPQFCLIGTSEVLASVSSMEFFYSQAPPQFRSVVQSFNLATTALGSLVVIPLILIVNSGGGDKARDSPSAQNTSGGRWVPEDLNYGHLDSFFFLLAFFMCANCAVLHYTGRGYEYQTDETLAAAQQGSDDGTEVN